MLVPGVIYSGSPAGGGAHFRLGDEEIVPVEELDNNRLWDCLMSALAVQHPVDLDEIKTQCAGLENSPGEMEQLIAELQQHGLLISAEKIDLHDPLERWVCHHRLYSSENIAAIRRTRLGICIPDRWETAQDAETLMQVFSAYGFTADRCSVADDLSAFTLLVVLADFSNDQLFTEVNRAAYGTGLPWLMLRQASTTLAQLGPLFLPQKTACHACLAARTFSNREHPLEHRLFQHQASGAARGLWLDWQARVMAEMAADEVLRWCLDRHLATLAGQSRFINLLDWSVQQEKVLQLPGCSVCDPVLAAE